MLLLPNVLAAPTFCYQIAASVLPKVIQKHFRQAPLYQKCNLLKESSVLRMMCKNCGMYFQLESGFKNKYCTRLLKDNRKKHAETSEQHKALK